MHSFQRRITRFCLAGIAQLAFASILSAQIDITTQRYGPARLGANLAETTLNAANVNAQTFGKLGAYTVSGSVFAQPLYVRDVILPGQGNHNVLYVVTMNDKIYAFDADTPGSAPLLSRDLTEAIPGSTPVPILDIVGPVNIVGNVGIMSTPYIDVATHTIYVVARTKEIGGQCGGPYPNYCQRLHALDMTTFEEKSGGPVLIGGSVPGTGTANVGGTLTFNTLWQDQRSSLAYSNGRIFMSWSSHEDAYQYHGWVMSFDAATLQRTSIWSSTPDGEQGGIWMAGRAPAVDADGNVYYMTGNGSYDGVRGFGESFLKFGTTPDVPLLDWFTPANWDHLNDVDADLGGSGPILIPGTDLIVGGGKAGAFYVTRTSGLGHEVANDAQIVQTIDNGTGQIKGGPVYYDRSGPLGPWMYVWKDDCEHLKAFRFNGSDFDPQPVSESILVSPCGSSGGVLTVSADASSAGSGIVWASMPIAGDANSGVHPGLLRAYDADDLTRELWNSQQNATRDSAGNWPKFSPPTVVNGRVYLASFPADGMGDAPLNVYGILPEPAFTIGATPPNPGGNPGAMFAYGIQVDALGGFTGAVGLSVQGLPAGATGTFGSTSVNAPGSTILTVQTSASTPLGASTLTITGTSARQTSAIAVGLVISDVDPSQARIGVDFVGGGVSMGAIERAGSSPIYNWNNAANASGGPLALVDEFGATTAATVSWSAGSVGNLGIADTPGDFRLMNGYIDAGAQTATVTIANLPPDPSGYSVIVYADGANAATARSGTYAIGGAQPPRVLITDAASTDFAGDFVRAGSAAGNYAVFFVDGTTFTLSATALAAAGNPHAPINAVQIVHGDRLFADGFD